MPRARRAGSSSYRSGLEEEVAGNLTSRGVRFSYENKRIEFTPPPKARHYTPDFELPNGILIEVKGYLTSEDRKKARWVKEQHPELDIRFLFGRACNRLNKQSSTTYADWCNKYGFKWCEKVVPKEWLDEQ